MRASPFRYFVLQLVLYSNHLSWIVFLRFDGAKLSRNHHKTIISLYYHTITKLFARWLIPRSANYFFPMWRHLRCSPCLWAPRICTLIHVHHTQKTKTGILQDACFLCFSHRENALKRNSIYPAPVLLRVYKLKMRCLILNITISIGAGGFFTYKNTFPRSLACIVS